MQKEQQTKKQYKIHNKSTNVEQGVRPWCDGKCLPQKAAGERENAMSIGRLPGNSAQEHQSQLDKGLLLEFYLQSELDLEFSSALQNFVILIQT